MMTIEYHWPTIVEYAQRARQCRAEAVTCSRGSPARQHWMREARSAEQVVIRRAQVAMRDLRRAQPPLTQSSTNS